MNRPLIYRKIFCVGTSLIAAVMISRYLPAELLTTVPMVQAATIVNGLVIGLVLTMGGVFTRCTVTKLRFHPLLRGGVLAAFVHLDFSIYTWPDPSMFWRTIIAAFIFGAIIDIAATQMFGEGRTLANGTVV